MHIHVYGMNKDMEIDMDMDIHMDIDMDIEMNIRVPKSGRLRSYHIKKLFCKKKQQN
jgi:hypothetical protein